jgi:diguanylate cyclase (GGDEF)-like protein
MVDDAEAGLFPIRSAVSFLVRISILALLLTTAQASAEEKGAPAHTTTLHAIHMLKRAEARRGLPVSFEGTVTYYNSGDVDLFVEDEGDAIYVETKPNQELELGDRVLIRGKTRDSFGLDVLSDSVTVLHHGEPPTPVAADFNELIRAHLDCMRVTVQGTVRSADTVNFSNLHGASLRLQMDGGLIDASVLDTGTISLGQLLDDQVEVTGVVSGKFDNKMQLIGIVLEVPSLAGVKVLKRASVSPDSLPITPMDQVLSSSYVRDLTHRVRVKGTITYYQPGSAVVLQNGNQSLWINTHSSNPMRIGDVATATGFPDASQGYLSITDGEIQDTNVFEPVQPQPSNWRQLSTWNSGDPDGHQSDLVSFEGKVATAVREESQDEFVLVSDRKLFTAIYRHPPNNLPLRPMWEIPVGTTIRVTGICMAVQPNTIDPTEQQIPFDILLRSYEDIAIVARPPLLNVRNLIILVGFLIALLFAAAVREWVRERKVHRQNAAAAFIERRRSRILEDINGSRSLAEILEQISELASFMLRDAHCWCQITDGAQLGNCPHDLTAFRVTSKPIPARSGPPLGTIFAAFDPAAAPLISESESLSVAASLASLAIETRRLYSDLMYRSEFDPLTDIHNRFSLEKYLDQQIDVARQNAGNFGLIYIDLNDFKQVNDVYGHQVGDLYLQEVAIRMKHQLRAVDMLARLGGDEFAVLLPAIRNRSEVEEIAHRLEQCLDEPFTAEGYDVHGSASVGIALYPEDGTSRDSLLTAADAAMYVNKHIRREAR